MPEPPSGLTPAEAEAYPLGPMSFGPALVAVSVLAPLLGFILTTFTEAPLLHSQGQLQMLGLAWGALTAILFNLLWRWVDTRLPRWRPWILSMAVQGLVFNVFLLALVGLEWLSNTYFEARLMADPWKMLACAGFVLVVGGWLGAARSLRWAAEVAQVREMGENRARAGQVRAQLAPHTLFNALNTIAALIVEDPPQAEIAVQRLSRLLRKVLSALEMSSWSLAAEFSLLEDLLSLERLRFEERLSYHLLLPETMKSTPLPPLLVLPLVENSLKHAFRRKLGLCQLKVEVTGRTILIEDNGEGTLEASPSGVGLKAVQTRLAIIGGQMDWKSGPEGTRVLLTLPAMPMDARKAT